MPDDYQLAAEAFDQLASAYEARFMDFDLYDDTYNLFCRLLTKPGAQVFEIGCGPGNITRYLLDHRPDFQIEAIDFAPGMIALARQNVPAAHFQVMDCRDIDQLTRQFDGIVCGFCMPYLSKADCTKLLRDCAALLRPGGLLYFSYIEGAEEQSGYEPSSNGQYKAYVHYHQEAFFRGELANGSIEVVEVKHKLYPKSADIISTHTIFLARKA